MQEGILSSLIGKDCPYLFLSVSKGFCVCPLVTIRHNSRIVSEECRALQNITAYLWVAWLIQLHHKLTPPTVHTETMPCSTYTYSFLTKDHGMMLIVLLSLNCLVENDHAKHLLWLTFVYLFYLISVKPVSHSWKTHFSKNKGVGRDTRYDWCWNKSAIFMLRSFRSTSMFHSDYLTMNIHKELFNYCDFIISAWFCNP